MATVGHVKGRPKPTAIHVLLGHQKSKLPKHEPKPKRCLPPTPAFLSARAKYHWNRYGPLLERIGVLTISDEGSLALLCESFGEYLEARDMVAKEGMTYTSENKDGGVLIKLHPLVRVMSDCDRRMRAWFVEFGMTPASRSRIIAVDPKAEDEESTADEYFN